MCGASVVNLIKYAKLAKFSLAEPPTGGQKLSVAEALNGRSSQWQKLSVAEALCGRSPGRRSLSLAEALTDRSSH